MVWGLEIGALTGCLALLDWRWFAVVPTSAAMLMAGFCGPFFVVAVLCYALYLLYRGHSAPGATGGDDAAVDPAATEEGHK